jgi:hypothetical protein
MRRILRWTDMRHKPFRSDCPVELDCYSSNHKTTLAEVIIEMAKLRVATSARE